MCHILKVVFHLEHLKLNSAEIDGHKVDVYSASAMCRVFDNLSHANQQKVEQMLKSKKGINTFAEFSIANI